MVDGWHSVFMFRSRSRVVAGDAELLEGGLNVWEFEEDRVIRDTFIVEHQADAPDDWRKTHILSAGQVVQDNLRLSFICHRVLIEQILK